MLRYVANLHFQPYDQGKERGIHSWYDVFGINASETRLQTTFWAMPVVKKSLGCVPWPHEIWENMRKRKLWIVLCELIMLILYAFQSVLIWLIVLKTLGGWSCWRTANAETSFWWPSGISIFLNLLDASGMPWVLSSKFTKWPGFTWIYYNSLNS